MGLEVDSSAFIAVERRGLGIAELRDAFPGETLVTSVVVVSELLHGVERAALTHKAERLRRVEAFIRSIPVIPVDLDVARSHAKLRAELGRSGQPIGPHDLWIAATALAYGHGVLTLNEREFRRVPGLRVEVLAGP